VTAGIRKLLTEDELRGVLAHELGHVRNHDILLTSVVATIAFRHHLDRLHGALDRWRQRLAARISVRCCLWIWAPISAAIIQMAISRQREYSADATGAEICGNPSRSPRRWLRLESGAQTVPMAGQPGDGAALHRQAVQGRRHRLSLLDASADRGEGSPAPPDAPDHRLVMAYRVLGSGDAFWRPSTRLKVENTDLAKQLEAETLGARLWRLAPARPVPAQAFPDARAVRPARGEGRVRVDDEVLTLTPLSALLVEPEHTRQLFNDTDADSLWLVVGAPRRVSAARLR